MLSRRSPGFRRLLIGVLCLGFVHVARADVSRDSFSAVVQANFSKWDRNHDGKLDAREVAALVTDHSVQGNAAAALAAIHAYQRGQKNGGVPLTLDLLTHPREGASGRRDKQEHLPHFEGNYHSYCNHLKKAPREIFVDKAPTLDAFRQGNLGDCYFLSSVGAAISLNAAAVKSMVHVHPDGACDLTFRNGIHVHVPRLTDAEICLGSSAGQQGLWLNILEKGFGLARLHRARKGVKVGEVSLDAISKGGDTDETISLFTGRKAELLSYRRGKGKEKSPPPAHELPVLEAKTRALLRTAVAGRFMLCAGTPAGKMPPGVVNDHAYAVLGYDGKTDTLHLWNPWGNHFEPKGGTGLEHGYSTKGGHFDMPLRDFVRVYEELYYETAVPYGARRVVGTRGVRR
jgi:hypothetical protein